MSLQKNLVAMLAPDSALAPAASGVVIAANPERGYLIIINDSDEAIALGFGGDAAVLGKGVILQPFGFYEMLNGKNLDQDAVEAISASGGKSLALQEANLVAS